MGREFFKIFDFRYYLGSDCASNAFFALKRIFLRAHQNALQILNQYIKTFQMSYRQPLHASFHPHSLPPSSPRMGRDGTEGEISQKVLIPFQQTRSQFKAYYYLFRGKKLNKGYLKPFC